MSVLFKSLPSKMGLRKFRHWIQVNANKLTTMTICWMRRKTTKASTISLSRQKWIENLGVNVNNGCKPRIRNRTGVTFGPTGVKLGKCYSLKLIQKITQNLKNNVNLNCKWDWALLKCDACCFHFKPFIESNLVLVSSTSRQRGHIRLMR